MTLQLHGTPMAREDELSTSITEVTVDLPYYLKTPGKGGDEKTGYQQLVEAGEKYGAFTKAELDEAMTLVGQGMGVDMGVDDPEKEKEKEARQKAEEEAKQAEAEKQAAVDAQANIGILDEEEQQAGEVKAEPEHKLLRAVEDRYYLAAELRDAPMPNHPLGGTAPSQYYNSRRDAEFGLEETRQRLQRQLSRMTSDQLDRVYLDVIDNESMSKLSLEDFQLKAFAPLGLVLVQKLQRGIM